MKKSESTDNISASAKKDEHKKIPLADHDRIAQLEGNLARLEASLLRTQQALMVTMTEVDHIRHPEHFEQKSDGENRLDALPIIPIVAKKEYKKLKLSLDSPPHLLSLNQQGLYLNQFLEENYPAIHPYTRIFGGKAEVTLSAVPNEEIDRLLNDREHVKDTSRARSV